MPRPSIRATTTTAVTTEVKIEPRLRVMIKERCEEHAKLARVISDGKARQKRIATEVTDIFKKGKQGKALTSGTALDDFSLKMVFGTRKKFDQLGFMKKHGLTQEDFDAFTSDEPNSPYLKITKGKQKGDTDEHE